MEIAYVEPMLLNMSDEPGIKAGMMAVVPHVEDDLVSEIPQTDLELWPGNPSIPYGSIICAGQLLQRALYPELSSVYAHTGGFYDFQLPDLVNKFIIGVTEDGYFIFGDGIIYYQDMPNTKRPSRNVLDS